MKEDELIESFRKSRPLYEDFVKAIYKLVESILIDGKYKYQMLYRIKELDKLKEKIKRKREQGKIYKKLEDIEDLAGLRIIFYFEVDKAKFLNELKKELSTDVTIKDLKKKSGYEAIHVIASFGEKRTLLSEYKKFKDLKCEIQLTSILHHAWAEIEHDMLYKNNLGVIQKKQLPIYRQLMQKILTNHLKKAAVEFDKIIVKIRKKGKK